MMCPECGNPPDTTRATCLTCLRGPRPAHPGDLDGTALAPVDFDLPPDTGECHAARTGEGYWTCDVPGGCPDCRALAREIDDTERLAAWDEDERDPTPCCPDPDCPGRAGAYCTFPGYAPMN